MKILKYYINPKFKIKIWIQNWISCNSKWVNHPKFAMVSNPKSEYKTIRATARSSVFKPPLNILESGGKYLGIIWKDITDQIVPLFLGFLDSGCGKYRDNLKKKWLITVPLFLGSPKSLFNIQPMSCSPHWIKS